MKNFHMRILFFSVVIYKENKYEFSQYKYQFQNKSCNIPKMANIWLKIDSLNK